MTAPVPLTPLEPAYGGRTLADVLPAVAAALGVDAGFAPVGLELAPAASYVVMLVDGLGEEQLRAHPVQTPYLSSLGGASGTCGVPSTTATSLASLGTALPPGAHGLVGYSSRVPGTDRVLQTLRWDDSVDPLQWQPHETAFARIAAAGAATTVVAKSDFARSGLTRSTQRGARYVGADDLTARVAAAVTASARRPSLTYVYDSELDATGHEHGVDSPAWRRALDDVDAACEQLREDLPADVRLLVLADHGMVDPTVRIDIDETPALRAGVALVAGEARFRHLYCHVGAEADVVAAWQGVLGDQALVLTREEATDRGWFGAVEDRVRPRLGDVVVAAGPDLAVLSSRHFRGETRLVGMHGSLTSAEMRIPILLD